MVGETHVYRIEGFAVPAELDRVHDLIEQAGAEHPEIDATDLMLFETAVIEIANNVVEHGKPTGEVRWRLVLSIGAHEIRVDLYDSAQAAQVQLGTQMPETDSESGRGLPLASALLDEIDVERTQEGNHWRLVRRFTSAPEA